MNEQQLAEDFHRLAETFRGVGKALTDKVEDLTAQQQRKVDALRQAQAAERKWQRRFAAAAIAFLLLLAGGIIVMIEGQRDIADIQKAGRANGQAIRDCTTPTGQCYKNSTKRTGEAIGSINQVTVIAAWCAKESTTLADTQTCVQRAVKTQTKTPTPTPAPSR